MAGTACLPPKCRTCGVAEWRHVCSRQPHVIVDATPVQKTKSAAPKALPAPKKARKK